MKFSRVLASSLFVACALATPLQAGPFREIVAFGDSLTDTGNVFNLSRGTTPPVAAVLRRPVLQRTGLDRAAGRADRGPGARP
jgi:phospholipase/lecithinase/hemolysin